MILRYDIKQQLLMLKPFSFISDKIDFEISNECMDFIVIEKNKKLLEEKIGYEQDIFSIVKNVNDILHTGVFNLDNLYLAEGFPMVNGFKKSYPFNWLPVFYILKYKKQTSTTVSFEILANCGPASKTTGQTITFKLHTGNSLKLSIIK